MKTYKIYTLGCKVNQYDSNKLAIELKQAGLVLAAKNADMAIINSCAVTKTAMIKSGRMIKLARKENPQAKIALTGCWPKAGKIKENVAGVDLVARTDDFKELIVGILSFRPTRLASKAEPRRTSRNPKMPQLSNVSTVLDPRVKPEDDKIKLSDRSRYFIKIQDGCEQFCSYCIIPYTRGKLTSREEKEIICEIEQAVENGYQEIVLCGIHLGLYGRSVIPAPEPTCPVGKPEFRVQREKSRVSGLRVKPAMTNYNYPSNNDNLTGLLKKLIKIKNLGRLRLSSIEITEVSDELIKLMAESNKICQHLHVPLQSGSDKILKLMNRPYNVKYYKNKIKRIRRALPDIALTTDVIVGFPGETEKDFKATEKFIRQIKFSRLHVFRFSAHEKTPAASIPRQAKEKTKAHRAKILRELGLKLAEDYKKKFKGRELLIVVERIKQNKIIGKTEYYFDVLADKKNLKNKILRAGQIINIKI